MDNPQDPFLEARGLHKYFGENHVLKGLDFKIRRGEAISVIGSSGGGKSTLLRCLTFLERLDSGRIFLDGEEIVREETRNVRPELRFATKERIDGPTRKRRLFLREKTPDGGTRIKLFGVEEADFRFKRRLFAKIVRRDEEGRPLKRMSVSAYPPDDVLRRKALKMGLVFQEFNLFPHKTVLENLALAPTLVSGLSREAATELARGMLDKVGLLSKADEYPCSISGGQKQRAAIARALCMQPEILCFDEPTSALDPELTGEVLRVIRELRDEGRTMIIVTHEMNFARNVSDRIAFVAEGKIIEEGSPNDIFECPKHILTQNFIKHSNESLSPARR